MPSHNTEILIVDESSTIRATIADFLGDDYIIYYATDGEEGLKLLLSNQSISLVFTDVEMPVMNGMQLLQKIRETDCERIANIPVIMIMSGAESEESKKAAHKLGATDFISKPFDKIDILCRTRSYTRFNQQISDLETKAAYDTLTGLYSNHMLLDFGHKTISFANRHNIDASVLYVEIADIDNLIEKHGSKFTGTIVSTVAGILERSIRNEELVAHLDDGRFALVLPKTKAFMAHIVASRVKETVEDMVFDIGDLKIQISLALGLCSTEDIEKSDKIAFEEYCVHAAHALAASLQTPNRRIVRYDETHEKRIENKNDSHPVPIHAYADMTDHEHGAVDAYAQYFSSILRGDYSNIPHESLPSLIEPLESFFEFAHSAMQQNKIASGE